MSAFVKWVWIIVLAVLAFGYYAALVFAIETALIGLMYWKKPEWFND